MTDESMQMGASVAPATVRSMSLSSSDSSTSGMPALTSSMSAPAVTWATASTATVDKSPPRSSSANVLRPVGLIRSPMTQKGWSWPMTTVLERDDRVVCMRERLLPFDARLEAELCAELGDARVLAERDEVKAGHAGQRERVRGQFEGELEARLLLVGGRLDALDDGGGDLDPRDLRVDEAQRARRAQDRDRRDQRRVIGEPDRLRARDEVLEHLGPVADLQLQEAGSGARLHEGALHAVLDRRRPGVLDGAEEQPRRGLHRPSGEVAPLGQHARDGEELRAVEVEDAAGLGLVTRRHVVAGEGDHVLDAVQRGADDVGLQREPIAVAADELHDRLDAALLQGDGHREG